MFLRDLAKSEPDARFRVTNCPWLKGRIMRSTTGGVTVKLTTKNQVPEDIAGGAYSSPIICMSGRTEVTEL